MNRFSSFIGGALALAAACLAGCAGTAGQNAEAAAPSGIGVAGLAVDPESPARPLVATVSATYGDQDSRPLDSGRRVGLRILRGDGSEALARTLVANAKGELVLDRLDGLDCGADYLLKLEAGTPDAPLYAEKNFRIDNPPALGQDGGGPWPALVVGGLVRGTLRVASAAPAGAEISLSLQGKELAALALDKAQTAVTGETGRRYAYAVDLGADRPAGTAELRYRFRFPSGLRSAWMSGGAVALGGAGDWRLAFPGANRPTLSATVEFSWQALAGASGYRLEISFVDPADPRFSPAALVVRETTACAAVVDFAAVGGDRPSRSGFFWRVVQPGLALASPWRRSFLSDELADRLVVVAAGESATFQRGDPSQPDAANAGAVVLTRPFAALRTPLTNRVCAELFNRLLERGAARWNGDRLVGAVDGAVWLGLGALDYGQQFGLRAENGQVAPMAGRENHPAVGVSWFGAQALCAEMGAVEGGAAWRLPSEAEWEYLATGGGRGPSPWGRAPAADTANYLRSRDAFEDVNPPYTRRGGPTVPVDYYARARAAAARGAAQPNFAALDILGNVWEWCADWYVDAYPTGGLRDPLGPPTLAPDWTAKLEAQGLLPARVVRGGAWNSLASEVGARLRGKFPPGQTSFSVGLRPVRALTP